MARPKGYAAWAPKPETVDLVGQVNDVLREYRQHLPLTVRQIFYRLVGQYGYDKTEKAYSRLCEHLVRARRAGMVPFSAIRDDGTIHHDFKMWDSAAGFWRDVADDAANYRRDRQAGQPVYVELWCEAGGMVPQMERVGNRYSVPVYSTGGFSSVTVTHEIAERALARGRPTAFLHVGDFDPSGESIFDAMSLDARSFLRARAYDEADPLRVTDEQREGLLHLGRPVPEGFPDLLPLRVALTGDQVEEHDLPTAPPKATDSRSVSWVGETCQAEAMPPDLLAETVEEAVRDQLDLDLYERTLEAEVEEGERLSERARQLAEEESGG